jgi:hypothetical protein
VLPPILRRCPQRVTGSRGANLFAFGRNVGVDRHVRLRAKLDRPSPGSASILSGRGVSLFGGMIIAR